MMSIERNKVIVRRYFDEVINGQNLAIIDDIVADDFFVHTPSPGKAVGSAGVKEGMSTFHSAFARTQTTIEDMVAEADKVVVRSITRGVHMSGRHVDYGGIDIFRISDGKLREQWFVRDHLTLTQQLAHDA